MALDRTNRLSTSAADVPARDPERHEPPAARLPWSTPRLETHESLTVLTQHFFGPVGVAFALQIGCGVSGKKFGC